MTAGSSAAAKAESSELCTTIKDSAEIASAHRALSALEAQGEWTRTNVVASLTIPRGAEYLDNTLVRFLRARKGDVDKAAAMMSEALRFRRRYDVDVILARPLVPELLEHVHKGVYEGLLPGFDKQGRPMYVLRGGASNAALHGLLEAPAGHPHWSLGQLEDAWVHWHLQMMEHLTTELFAEATRRKGSLVNKYVVVDDLKGFSLQGVKGLYNVIGIFKKIAWIDQLLYPELLSLLLFTHAPAVFRGPWKVISSLVDADTNRKICVLGGAAQVAPALDALFAREQLPEALGGALAGNHISCAENPRTPAFDALHARVAAAGAAAGFDAAKRSQPMTLLAVKAGAEARVETSVRAGEVVEWQLVVDAHEVACTGEFNGATVDDAMHESTGGTRLQGSFAAREPGTFALVLSNKHSRLRSKHLRYRLFTWQPANTTGTVTESTQTATAAMRESTATVTAAAPVAAESKAAVSSGSAAAPDDEQGRDKEQQTAAADSEALSATERGPEPPAIRT